MVDHLKGKVKNFNNYLNNLIKNQTQVHQGNPDKPYKPRPSRARKAKGGLSPSGELDYEPEEVDLEEGDDLIVGQHEMLSRKRLRPRKAKVNYFEMEEGNK